MCIRDRLEVAELGAPVGFTTRTHCEYQYVRVRSYIEAAERMVLEETLPNSTVYREPVGVVACVTPWNYPLGQVVQKVVPAILMGCTVVQMCIRDRSSSSSQSR